jgi:radical SAM protein with 4Fe4S-binding SPASM domain
MEFDDELSHKDFQQQRKDFYKIFEGLPIDKFIVRTPHNWGGLLEIENLRKIRSKKDKFIACTFPWYALTIFYNGMVYLCPQDFFGAIPVGDISKESVKEIFNSEIMQNNRRRFRDKNINDIEPCNSCDRCWRKTFMGVPQEYLGVFLKDNLKTLR